MATSRLIAPMLATLVDKPAPGNGWLYEVKWDGYRAIAYCNGSKVELVSRNNKSFNDKFYPVHAALQAWKVNAVVDGEICVLDAEGIARFGDLQNWRSEADGELVYYVFDLLRLKGRSLLNKPLSERRRQLEQLLPAGGIIRLSEHFNSPAEQFLEAAGKMGLEGIIAKKADSPYEPGERSRNWLKIKTSRRHEVVIGGYTRNEGSPKAFSSLLVGVYENGRLQYTGKIGTGFNAQQQATLMALFKTRVRKQCPFTAVPDVNKPSRFRPNPPKAEAVWLKPDLVCEVSYAEITADGVMRHPSFEGLRSDKAATDVHPEVPAQLPPAAPGAPTAAREKNTVKLPLQRPGKATRKTLLNPSESTQVKKVSGHSLTFNNLGKIYWPAEKYTKRDMLNYYYQAAPYLLPYIAGRPQSLNRYPNGINGKSFYQKDVTEAAPDWMKLEPYTTSEGEHKNFLVPQTEADLLWMANLGAIEINPWNSTVDKPDYPDWCCLDLDPDTGNTFEQVITTAQAVKAVLDEFGIRGYPKTSGSTGIHVYIPLQAKYTYDECQLFGKLIATRVHQRLPRFTSIERFTRNRKGKLYIDYLQNRPKATLAAPYSLRPKPGATVSMPLHWEEVKKGLKLKDFHIGNAMARLKAEGDLFKPVLGKGVNIERVLRRLQKMD